MKKLFVAAVAVVASVSALIAGDVPAMRATGDLSVYKGASAALGIVSAGDTISYYLSYDWTGDGPATGVSITDPLPPAVTFLSAYPTPTSVVGSTYSWTVGQLNDGDAGVILVTVIVGSGLSPGTVISNTATVAGTATDIDPSNNQSTFDVTVQLPAPDLYVFHYGLLESLESGFFFTGEKGIPFDLLVFFYNLSGTGATNVVVTDTLPAGLTYLSATPAPVSVVGQVVTWNVGNLSGYNAGSITLSVQPGQSGQYQSTVHIASTETDRDPLSNQSAFAFEIVDLLPPRLLKPAVATGFGSGDTLVTSKTPTFEGLAKAGATVTVYEGSSAGCIGDLSGCNPVVLGSVVAGSDRRWSLPMTAMNEARTYNLYFQAELGANKSSPPFGFWMPVIVTVDSIFDAAGVDLANFVVASAGQQKRPGFAGGSSGTTPDEPVDIIIRQSACDDIESNMSLWTNHTLRLVIDGSEVFLPVGQVVRATPTTPGKLGSFDFIYTIPGQAPGSTVEVWYKPVAYDSTCAALVALTYVKFVDILIDPAGYVYDVDLAGGTYEWPDVPPANSLITTATVSALTRTGDAQWEIWDADPSGQINPQVTDATTPDNILVEGYYAFYVPSGQYRVEASAPGYADHASPILTVIDAPVFYNVGMNPAPGSVTSVTEGDGKNSSSSALPEDLILEQNFPNPFNPSTTIAFALSRPGFVTLTIYDALGRTVANLVGDELRSAGRHSMSFDASGLASGMYLYRLTVRDLAGASVGSVTRRLLLVR
jgi:uncharacterized repeat protein (TIGR01451 family)